MAESILFNTNTRATATDIDEINDQFYSRFNYPWAPLMLPITEDSQFYSRALNNDLGYYKHPRLPADMAIWVAGCGTNQAVLTALKFPNARIIGTDISQGSLRECQRLIDQIGLKNVTLKHKSLNEETQPDEFDYIICTGVIHHNSAPSTPLKNIAKSLRKGGILELMVYNYYHRIQTTAFQKAIRILSGSRERPNVERELPLTRQFVDSFSTETNMGELLRQLRDSPEAEMADALLQPVEHSYTIASLNELAAECGLRLTTYCLNQFDRFLDRIEWELPLYEGPLRQVYDPLNDIDRWQITNLIMGEKSPMLWFYLQSIDSNDRAGERQLTNTFLDTSFVPDRTFVRHYILGGSDQYHLSGNRNAFPAPVQPTDPTASAVFQACDGKSTIREILQRLGISLDFRQVNRLRLRLATTAYPYLRAATQA